MRLRSFLLHLAHVYYPLQASLWCPYFWHLKHLRSARIYCSTLSRKYLIFTSLGIWGWLNVRICVLVWICSVPFLWGFFWCLSHPVFPRAAVISPFVANAASLLLIIPLEVFSLSREYALHLMLFILRMFSPSTMTSKFPLHVCFMFLEVALIAITFSIEKRKNLAWQNSSKDSMTMNIGKSAASFSKSNLYRFFLVFP